MSRQRCRCSASDLRYNGTWGLCIIVEAMHGSAWINFWQKFLQIVHGSSVDLLVVFIFCFGQYVDSGLFFPWSFDFWVLLIALLQFLKVLRWLVMALKLYKFTSLLIYGPTYWLCRQINLSLLHYCTSRPLCGWPLGYCLLLDFRNYLSSMCLKCSKLLTLIAESCLLVLWYNCRVGYCMRLALSGNRFCWHTSLLHIRATLCSLIVYLCILDYSCLVLKMAIHNFDLEVFNGKRQFLYLRKKIRDI